MAQSADGRQPGGNERISAPAGVPHPWDAFLTGPENELAFAGVQALARGEREGISPLVVHGPSGVGKSRLLAGLVFEWLRRQPGDSIAHLDAASFAEACLEAARQHDASGTGWSELRARFRFVNLLILDDLENLERAPLARNELIHTLDALDVHGASIAVSSRTAPGQWPRAFWPARLVNRLVGGLAVRIDPPGLVSRRRYLLDRSRASGLALSADSIESLAESADGYRTLDGWLARLALNAGMDQPSRQGRSRPLDLSSVTAALQEETDMAATRMTIEQIARAVSLRFGVRVSALRGAGRSASVVEVRHLAMHLARLHTDLSFAAIGAYFGGRDPATVRHACKAASVRLNADPALASAFGTLLQPLQR